MGSRTKIEWATVTPNPITGCTDKPVHEGCRNCYARRMANRLRGRFGYPADNPFRLTFHPERLKAFKKYFRERVFVNSMGDLFLAPREWIDAVFRAIYSGLHNENLFIILTKQPDLATEYINGMFDRDDAPMPHGDYRRIVIGASVCNQPTADDLISKLLRIEKMFTLAVSVEPMLGPVDLKITCVKCQHYNDAECPSSGNYCIMRPRLDWVICGGESGPGARPMHPDWVRSLRDQTVAAGVPFFFKQWGEWVPGEVYSKLIKGRREGGFIRYQNEQDACAKPDHWWSGDAFDGLLSTRVGKKAAGCLLDGREYLEIPEVNS